LVAATSVRASSAGLRRGAGAVGAVGGGTDGAPSITPWSGLAGGVWLAVSLT
jgi:hypothetical protein